MIAEPGGQNVVEMQGIVKRFPGVAALDHVDFALRPGEVHVLLGENGAGKSTLIKVLSGAYIPEEGEIRVEGEPAAIRGPQDALDLGLRFIYQELNLVRTLDIARNIFLGKEPSRGSGLIDSNRLYTQASELLERFHIELDPRELVGRLSVTQQKMVEIARALTTRARVIVLDEPTDVLEDRSRRDLFQMIGQLKREQNVSFIYISHRYGEVHEVGDRVTILRDGRNVGTYEIAGLPFDRMIELMIGGQVKRQYPDLPMPASDEALRVEGLCAGRLLHDVNLSVRRGEIVGVTGLMGAGKTELGRAIAGIDAMSAGRVLVQGQEVQNSSPERAIQEGIAYLPEDRKTQGLVLDHSIRDNYALPSLSRLSPMGIVQHGKLDAEAAEYLQRLQIKAPGIRTYARQLSGGNQQKAVVAKWLGARSKVLIFDEPTRGIDINGRREIYRVMQELAEHGVGILMLTSDYTEAVEMSHRVVVMRRGAVCAEHGRGETTESEILREAIGVTEETAP
jgi:ribose transport system ATP-binding protein